MNLNTAYEIINKCLTKDEDFKEYYNSKFTADFDEDIGMLFMLSKGTNLSDNFKKIIGEGSVQICYETNRGGSILVRTEFEFDKWSNKIAENVDFALNNLGFKFKYTIEDHESDYGYNNVFEIYRDNIDNDLENELSELFVIFAFILDV